MLRHLTARAVLLLFVAACLANPVAARAAEAPAEAVEEAEATTAPPQYTAEDVLYVEAILPDIATTGSIATKLPLALQRTPASVSVVTSALFNEQAGFTLSDALLNVPGVNVQTQSGVTDYFLIRGFDALSSGLVLTDGASEPEASYYHLYNVERVEVLRGPSAFLYGGNTLSGAASLVRKQPTLRSGDSFVEFGLEGGSFATYRGHLDWNRNAEKLSFRLNAFVEDSDGYRDDKESQAYAINPAITWALGDSAAFTVNAEVVRNEYSPDSGLPFFLDSGQLVDVPRERSYQAPFDFSEQDVFRLRADYSRQLGSNVTLRNKTYFTNLDWQSDGTLLVGAFRDPFFGLGLVGRLYSSLDDEQEFFGNQLEAVLALDGDTVEQTIVAGFELERRTDQFSLDLGQLPILLVDDPIESAFTPPPPIPFLGQRGDADNLIAALYAVDQLQITETFGVLLGGRVDFLDYEEKVSGTQRDDTEFSPTVGLVYAPTKNLTLYANASQAFSPPSTLVIGDIAPEESTQFELGVKRTFLDGRLLASLALYDLEKSNIAIPDQTGITRQIGDQQSQGLELEVTGLLAPGLRLFFSYAYTDAELTEFREIFASADRFFIVDYSGNVPAFVPENTASLWLSKRFNKLGVAGGARWVDDQFIDEDNVLSLDGYLTVDLALSYHWRNWEYRLNLKNVTDEEYERRGFQGSAVIPADPFTVLAGVRFRM